jgi:hypothetical protein
MGMNPIRIFLLGWKFVMRIFFVRKDILNFFWLSWELIF